MNKLRILMVRPTVLNDEEHEDVTEDDLGLCDSDKELTRCWELYKRFEKVMLDLGGDESKYGSFTLEGFNSEGTAHTTMMTISAGVIAKLEGVSEERRKLREQGMAKLTPEEQDAMGVFDEHVETKWMT